MKRSPNGSSASRTSPAARLVSGVAAAALLSACAAESEPTVSVGFVEIPESAVASLADPERETLLDLLAFGVAVAAEATDTLLAPFAQRAVDRALVEALPAALGAMASGMGDAELRDAYDAAPEWELEVRHMVRLVEPGTDAAERERQRGVAEQVAARAAAGVDFAPLAAAFSEEPGATERGGLLEPGRRGSWVEPFWAAASLLQPGETSGVVETEYGFHVLMLEARRPVPYAEADRNALLSRVVPAGAAASAMEEWASTDGSILIDPPALQEARAAIVAGRPPVDSLVIATGAGAEYRGGDLVAGWGLLSPEARRDLETRDQAGFASWVEDDARTVLWAEAARSMGIDAGNAIIEEARARWAATSALWAGQFGFAPRMAGGAVYEAARRGALSGAPEQRAARLQLRSLRPRLRSIYPAEASAP